MESQEMMKRLELLPANVKLCKEEIKSWILMPIEISHTTCESSNVKAYGWHAESRTLKVIFSNGSEYRYLGVNPNIYVDLQESTSKGSVLARAKQCFQAIKIEPTFYICENKK